MELRSQINTILAEIPGLWQCLKHNTYPESFLINAMGFQPETCGRLPQILILFLGFYLVCAIATLGLRFGLKQRSLCSIPQQVGNAAVVCCGIPLTRLLIFLSKACFYIVGNKVAPLQRGEKEGELLRFLGDAIHSVFYLALSFVGIMFILWMPMSAFYRYLKTYRLRGLFHAVFDVGFGVHVMTTVLLATFYENQRLYLMLLPAVAALLLIQKGGYLPETRSPFKDSGE